MPYSEIGLASGNIKFENSWMEFFEDDWETELKFLKITNIDFTHMKPYFSDGVNNLANNTDPRIPGTKQFPEILTYWNFYHTDELETTKWIFYTYIDNLSFLGGLLDILLLFPSIIMFGYTFRLNEINVFFYQQMIEQQMTAKENTKDKDTNKNQVEE